MVGVRIYGRTGEALRQYTLPWNFGRNRYPGRREAPDTAQWINGNASITQFIDELLTHYLAADTTGSKMCDGCAAS